MNTRQSDLRSLGACLVSFVPDMRPTGIGPNADAIPETNPNGPRALARLMIRRALYGDSFPEPTPRKEPICWTGWLGLGMIALVPLAALVASYLRGMFLETLLECATLALGPVAVGILSILRKTSSHS